MVNFVSKNLWMMLSKDFLHRGEQAFPSLGAAKLSGDGQEHEWGEELATQPNHRGLTRFAAALLLSEHSMSCECLHTYILCFTYVFIF